MSFSIVCSDVALSPHRVAAFCMSSDMSTFLTVTFRSPISRLAFPPLVASIYILDPWRQRCLLSRITSLSSILKQLKLFPENCGNHFLQKWVIIRKNDKSFKTVLIESLWEWFKFSALQNFSPPTKTSRWFSAQTLRYRQGAFVLHLFNVGIPCLNRYFAVSSSPCFFWGS